MFGLNLTSHDGRVRGALVRVAFGLLCATGLLGRPLPAAADDSVQGEVMVILAKAEPGAFDPKLARIAALRKMPFDGYKSMALLSTHQVRLSADQPATAPLPKGRKLMLKLLGKTKDGRYRIQVSINKPGKADYLPLLTVIASPEPFFVAGQHYQGGTLVIGVRVER